MKQINQKYKDSLFRLLFGREDMKDNIMNMVITEFNEEVFVKGIREEGREEGQNSLIEAIERLRNGESKEEIIASGIDEHTVELAEGVK